MTVLYTDGGCSGNGQTDVAQRVMSGVVVTPAGVVLSEFSQPGGSNNIAELQAVRDALRWCVLNGVTEVEIRTDSMNNFAWAKGRRPGKQINDRQAVLALQQEIAVLPVAFRLVYVSRDENLAGLELESRVG